MHGAWKVLDPAANKVKRPYSWHFFPFSDMVSTIVCYYTVMDWFWSRSMAQAVSTDAGIRRRFSGFMRLQYFHFRDFHAKWARVVLN